MSGHLETFLDYTKRLQNALNCVSFEQDSLNRIGKSLLDLSERITTQKAKLIRVIPSIEEIGMPSIYEEGIPQVLHPDILRVDNCAVKTTALRQKLRRFINWLREDGLETLSEILSRPFPVDPEDFDIFCKTAIFAVFANLGNREEESKMLTLLNDSIEKTVTQKDFAGQLQPMLRQTLSSYLRVANGSSEFLGAALRDSVLGVLQTVSSEGDMSHREMAKNSIKIIDTMTKQVLANVARAVTALPTGVVLLVKSIYKIFDEHGLDAELKYSLVGDLVFGDFIGSCIVSPDRYGLISEYPVDAKSRYVLSGTVRKLRRIYMDKETGAERFSDSATMYEYAKEIFDSINALERPEVADVFEDAASTRRLYQVPYDFQGIVRNGNVVMKSTIISVPELSALASVISSFVKSTKYKGIPKDLIPSRKDLSKIPLYGEDDEDSDGGPPPPHTKYFSKFIKVKLTGRSNEYDKVPPVGAFEESQKDGGPVLGYLPREEVYEFIKWSRFLLARLEFINLSLGENSTLGNFLQGQVVAFKTLKKYKEATDLDLFHKKLEKYVSVLKDKGVEDAYDAFISAVFPSRDVCYVYSEEYFNALALEIRECNYVFTKQKSALEEEAARIGRVLSWLPNYLITLIATRVLGRIQKKRSIWEPITLAKTYSQMSDAVRTYYERVNKITSTDEVILKYRKHFVLERDPQEPWRIRDSYTKIVRTVHNGVFSSMAITELQNSARMQKKNSKYLKKIGTQKSRENSIYKKAKEILSNIYKYKSPFLKMETLSQCSFILELYSEFAAGKRLVNEGFIATIVDFLGYYSSPGLRLELETLKLLISPHLVSEYQKFWLECWLAALSFFSLER